MGWQNTTGKLLACNLSADKVHGVQSTVSNILAGKVPAGNVWVGKTLQANYWRAFSQQAKYMACKVQVCNKWAGKVPAGNIWVGKLVHVQLDWRATDQRPFWENVIFSFFTTVTGVTNSLATSIIFYAILL